MSTRLYTNTSKFGSVAGLLVTTVLVSYCTTNATKIVDGTVKATKDILRKANSVILHEGKQEYAVIAKDSRGNYFDTGKRIWK